MLVYVLWTPLCSLISLNHENVVFYTHTHSRNKTRHKMTFQTNVQNDQKKQKTKKQKKQEAFRERRHLHVCNI